MTKKKLHILFLNSWYPSKVLPYNGDFIQRHAEAVATKHKVTSIHVVSNTNVDVASNITINNINGVYTIIAYVKPLNNKLFKQIQFFKTYKKLLKLSGNFDLVHVNRLYPVGIIALWLKLFKSKPFIISEHFTGYLKPLSRSWYKFETFFSKIIVKQAKFVCPVSKNLASNMQILGLNGNYKPIPNVVNTDTFVPIKMTNKPFTLIHISNLVNEHKNVEGILKVIAEIQNYIPNFLFYLIGNNPSQYQNLINSLNIDSCKIRLIDQIPHVKIAGYLQKSDVLLSFSNFENLPCVILEAFSCGVKVISTDVGGINEFFPKEFGELIPAKDETELKHAIIKLYQAKKNTLQEEMHQFAINNFGIEKISCEFSKLYFQSINKNVE